MGILFLIPIGMLAWQAVAFAFYSYEFFGVLGVLAYILLISFLSFLGYTLSKMR